MLAAVALGASDDLAGIAAAAAEHAEAEEEVEAILVVEAVPGERTYVCAFKGPRGRTWLAFDARAVPLARRARVRDAVSVAAMCEVAEESAGGGSLEELRSRLVALRLTENPPGIDEAEAAAHALETTIASPPRVASLAYLDAVGAATRRLESALGEGGSPFASAMQQALPAVEELAKDVESHYKLPLT
jgi:hypothetical protein